MKRIKCSVFTLLFAVMSVVSLTTFPGSARAMSAYDQVVNPVDALVIPNRSLACGRDFSLTWASDFRNFLSGATLTSFDNRVAWGVSLFYSTDTPDGSYIPDGIFINWWEEGDLPDTAIFKYGNALAIQPTHQGYLSVVWWPNCGISGGVFPHNPERRMAVYDLPAAEHSVRPFLLYGVDIEYPSGYEGETIPSEYTPPSPTYVAMGDSFSSGEGNPPFTAGTDSGLNNCHRSNDAYPLQLQTDNSLNLGPANFVACSGATTSDVRGITEMNDPEGKWNEPAQVDALSINTDAVTITIGGNDVGFSDYAYACVVTLCGPGTFDYNYVMNAINAPTFSLNLIDTYEAILGEAPNAQVYVIGYPHLAAESSGACGQVDLSGAWAVQNQLNSVIEDAVDGVASSLISRIHFVDANYAGSPFNGGHLCNGGESDFNGLDLNNTAYSFHPNTIGQQHYTIVVKDAMQ